MVDPRHRRFEHDPDRWKSDDDLPDFGLSFVEVTVLGICIGLVISLALILWLVT